VERNGVTRPGNGGAVEGGNARITACTKIRSGAHMSPAAMRRGQLREGRRGTQWNQFGTERRKPEGYGSGHGSTRRGHTDPKELRGADGRIYAREGEGIE
jgi:hypothetical protein